MGDGENMRLLVFVEYLRDLDNDPTPSATDQQLTAYLREFMTADPSILIDDH